MITPIYKAITDYISKDITRLHMPGHKGRDIYGIKNLWEYDITEIEGLDNLLDSNGVIKQTEDLYSQVYGCARSVISTQGSTLGVQMMLTAALMAEKHHKRKIIIDRNVHVSAVNTMALLDMEPIWVYPDIKVNDFMSGLISAKNIEKHIIDNPDADIVYITSPNYFGLIMDLKSIAQICKKYDKLLLVDNAHGAHLKFISDNLHPIDCGCSCCCDSLHKTLPVLTGGGLVHISDKRLILNIKKAQRIYSSTSPSYIIMLSIDLLLNYINNYLKEDLRVLIEKVKELNILAESLGFDIPNGNIDPIKFVVAPGILNLNSQQMARIFKEYKIEPEYISDYWLLFIFSPQSQDRDFERVKDVLKYVSKSINKENKDKIRYSYNNLVLEKGLSIREAVFSNSKKVSTIDSLDMISTGVVTTYPPGVPLIMPGEIVSRETIDLLLSQGIETLAVNDRGQRGF